MLLSCRNGSIDHTGLRMKPTRRFCTGSETAVVFGSSRPKFSAPSRPNSIGVDAWGADCDEREPRDCAFDAVLTRATALNAATSVTCKRMQTTPKEGGECLCCRSQSRQ